MLYTLSENANLNIDAIDFINTLTESCFPNNGNIHLKRDHMILENGEYIHDCSFLINEEMVQEYIYDKNLIETAALLEGAKLDLALKNFLKEGKDYKGLKSDVQKLVDMYDLDDRKLISGRNAAMHLIKRILQVLADIEAAITIGAGIPTVVGTGVATALTFKTAADAGLAVSTGAVAAGITGAVLYSIVIFIIYFLWNRLWRLIYDSVEFYVIEKDANEVIDELKDLASECKDKKRKKKYEEEAEKLRKKLKEYRQRDKDKSKKKDKKKNKDEDDED